MLNHFFSIVQHFCTFPYTHTWLIWQPADKHN